MARDNNRLIMELEKQRRDINREMINPTLATVGIETFLPVVRICARARAAYITCLMEIASDESGEVCTYEQIKLLKQHRVTYDELISAANALEAVIKRDYVDVSV